SGTVAVAHCNDPWHLLHCSRGGTASLTPSGSGAARRGGTSGSGAACGARTSGGVTPDFSLRLHAGTVSRASATSPATNRDDDGTPTRSGPRSRHTAVRRPLARSHSPDKKPHDRCALQPWISAG